MERKWLAHPHTHLCDLFQKLKLFDVVVPLDPQSVGHGLQTLPHLLPAAVDDALPLITAEEVR